MGPDIIPNDRSEAGRELVSILSARSSVVPGPSSYAWALGLGSVGVAGLYLTSLYSYLLFHTLAELFTVVVAFSIFVIAWNSRDYIENGYLLFVGIAYLALGLLDLLHTLGYTGMPVFPGHPFAANQLWIAARFLECLSLLVAFTFLSTERRPDTRLVLSAFVLVTGLIIASIFFWRTFPACFVAGQGQTRFKILSEYAIIAILAVDAGLLVHHRLSFQRSIYHALLAATLLAILTEAAFTLYVSNYGPSNLVGHFLKVFSYACIYVAIVESCIQRPNELIFRELAEINKRLGAEVEAHGTTEKERKRAEAALRESVYFFEESQRVARVGSYKTDFSHGTWESSAALDEIYGIGPDYDRTVQGWLAIIHPEDRDMMQRHLEEDVLQQGQPFDKEYRIVRRSDGDLRWVQGLGETKAGQDGSLASMVGTIMDITDRKRAELKLRSALEEANRFREALDHVPAFIYMKDLDGRYIYANRPTLELFGCSREELPGLDDGALFPMDTVRRLQEVDARVFQGETTAEEIDASEASGSRRIYWEVKSPLYATEGDRAIWGLIGISTDITKDKLAEENADKLQAQLLQAQKLEGLGTLAGGVAHDMNNVLGAILGLASASMETLPAGSPARRAFDTITQAATRGGKMVRSLLSFARQSPVEERLLDLNAVLRDQVAMLEPTTLGQVRLDLDLAEHLRPIRGDATALTHAFMNLCLNAVDAMPEGGVLTLQTRNTDRDWVEVVVTDTGVGMPPEVLEKALDPFFTTKEVGKGTGLGLAMVYRTVQSHRGKIELVSQPGQGTSVRLQLPASEAPVAVVEAKAAIAAKATHQTLAVLVVDDDEMIQGSLLTMLEFMGHQTVGASSGEEALARLEAGLEPDLAILDMNMPGLGGAGTLPRLRGLRPKLPVILSTGRTDQTALALAAAHSGVTLLSKPFGLMELQKHLQSIDLG